jgi:dTDP-4-amino-4,6-dideoxygalactose transaminase
VLNSDIEDFAYNYAYYPVLFKDEEELLKIKTALTENGINARRYFYPSLNKVPYIANTAPCVVSENVSSRVLSLPLYSGLTRNIVQSVASSIISALS